jgi:probable rRNA maturation factor
MPLCTMKTSWRPDVSVAAAIDESLAMDAEPDSCEISIESSPEMGHAISREWLEARLHDAIRHFAESTGRRVQSIGVRIVGDQAMTALHRAHSGIDATTDVLTFDLSEDATAIHAELVMCADEAARRSSEFGHSIEQELLLYVIHGVLHCAGFDDHEPTDAAAMHAEEDRILRAIGVGDTFKSAPRSDKGNAPTP